MSQEIICIDGCQPFDCYSQHLPNSPETELVLGQRAYKYLCEDRPDFVRTEANLQVLLDVLNFMGVPITRRNLTIAFDHISSKNPGALETRDTATWDNPDRRPVRDPYAGIKRVGSETLKLSYATGNAAQRQLAGEGNPAELDQLTDIAARRIIEDTLNYREAGAPGQPISKEFRTKYINTLGARTSQDRDNRIAAQNATLGVAPKIYYAAADQVLAENDGVSVNSITFKNLVRAKLVEQGHLRA